MRLPSEGAELRRHPFGALLLEKCGRRNPAQLEMDLVDPLLFPGEPLQTLPHPAQLRDIGDGHRRGHEIGRHLIRVYRRG